MANFFSTLFSGGQPGGAVSLQETQARLQRDLEEQRRRTDELTRALRSGDPDLVSRARSVAGITTERERASGENAIEILNKSQPSQWQGTARRIKQIQAADASAADAETRVIGAEGDRALALQRGFGELERGSREWTTNDLLPAMTRDYLARNGGTRMDFLNKAAELDRPGPLEVLQAVLPLAGLALLA